MAKYDPLAAGQRRVVRARARAYNVAHGKRKADAITARIQGATAESRAIKIARRFLG